MTLVWLALERVIELRMQSLRNPNRYDLAQLLSGITPENLHAEIDFGPPVGRELL